MIQIVIPGPAIGKPRMTQRDKWKKRDCVVQYRAWADELRLRAGKLPPAETIDRLDWKAFFEPPARWSKKTRALSIGTLHRTKPDRDNIDKAILDALFKDDSGIARGTLEKFWGESARLEITIHLILPIEDIP